MATHGWWCGSKAFPTRCRYCHSDVFYFSCNCGSKVFFDDLGGDWPLHDCTAQILKQVQVAIEDKYAKRIILRKKAKIKLPPIKAIYANSGEVVEDLGIVREVCDVDVYKKFRIPREGGLSAAFLGRELVKNHFTQVTVYTGGLSADQVHSYTFLVSQKEWEQQGLSKDDLIIFKIKGMKLPSGETYWFCQKAKLPS